MSKKRIISYSLYEIVFLITTDGKWSHETKSEWMNRTEFAALKRSNKWKVKVSCKKLSTIKIELSL